MEVCLFFRGFELRLTDYTTTTARSDDDWPAAKLQTGAVVVVVFVAGGVICNREMRETIRIIIDLVIQNWSTVLDFAKYAST